MLCWTLCYPMDCSMPGEPVLHCVLEFAQTHVHWVGYAIQPSHPLSPSFSCPQSFPASRSFPMTHLFASGGQSIGVSASVLLMNIQGHYFLALFQICCFQSLTLCHGSEGGQANQRPLLGPWKSDTFRRWRDEFSGGIGSQAHFGEGSRCIYFGRKKIVSLEGCNQIWSPKYGNQPTSL